MWHHHRHDDAQVPRFSIDQWTITSRAFVNYSSLITIQDGREKRRSDFGYDRFAFDVLISDKIGPWRDIPDTRHELCTTLDYGKFEIPAASIVICYFNEALSVLIRMINGLLDRTPARLIKEILLIDDWSDDGMLLGIENAQTDIGNALSGILGMKLETYLLEFGQKNQWPFDKIKFSQTEKRLGLIQCRAHGAHKATGEVCLLEHLPAHWSILMPK